MKDENCHFYKSRSTPDFKLRIMIKMFSVITALLYRYVQAYMHPRIFACLNESLGFRHKLLFQQLPKAVTIDWTQVLRIIKYIRSIII